MHSVSTLVRLREDTGTGAPVVMLAPAGSSASPTASLLAREYRLLTLEIAQGAAQDAAQELVQALARITPDAVGVIASPSLGHAALWLALSKPEAVNAVALLEPAPLDAALASRLSSLKQPVLALFGTRGAATPPALGKVYRQTIPNCLLTYVYAADADMDRQRPEAVAAALAEFLRTRERYVVTTKSSKLYP